MTEPVNPFAKYAAAAGLLFLSASAICIVGLSLAGQQFARVPAAQTSEPESVASVAVTGTAPQSALLGSDPARVAREASSRKNWVEVVDAVNMRQGPSSADAVVKVQIAGTRLEVASREGKWVEVIEPESGETGWVFDTYVKPVAPASRRAEATETAIR